MDKDRKKVTIIFLFSVYRGITEAIERKNNCAFFAAFSSLFEWYLSSFYIGRSNWLDKAKAKGASYTIPRYSLDIGIV